MSVNSSSAGHSVRIRAERTASVGERSAIRSVIEAAFGGSEEADLVDKLRSDEHALLSLVAESDGDIVGHILFSRMWIKTASGLIVAVALAPLAVRPDWQRKQIGRRLIEHGLDGLRAQGERIVIVAGHPGYYPRFGFSTEKAASLESPFPREAFLAMELAGGALAGVQGPVIYPPPFGI
jgi:putative acetyltransferase